jgi:uncharacterized protein
MATRSIMKWVLVLAAGTAVGGALMASSCDDPNKSSNNSGSGGGAAKDAGKSDDKAASKTQDVKLNGKTFHLELALDSTTRFKGLSDRTSIDPEGGMLFVFPRPETLSFVMRDCPVDIDIIFLDGTGRVLATHQMKAESPRTEDEKKLDPATGSNKAYEDRLKKYSSGYDAQFVIELKGGTLDQLNIKKGDKISLDVVKLKQRAK